MPRPFEDAGWCAALTLAERAELLRAPVPRAARSSGGDSDDAERRARAQRTLDAWRRQPPFDRGDWLARRLAPLGLDAESFARLLETPLEKLHARVTGPPPWLAELRAAYAAGGDLPPVDALSLPEALRADPRVGLLQPFTPLVERARARLRAGLARLGPALPAPADDVERLLLGPLTARLLWMIDRTMVLELNVARLQGRLAGDTPAQRYASFVAALSRRDVALELLREYVVLARLVTEQLERWLTTSLELAARLCADRPALAAAFFGGHDPGLLVGLHAGAGDAHHDGRAVAILSFASGERLVYKPRPLALDAHFQELLAWLERDAVVPGLRRLRVLDRGAYGWMEFAAAEPCASPGDVRRHHLRLGALLALLHAVAAVDVHFENLVAAGDQPMVVDLESLFHPLAPRPPFERLDERLAARALGASVLRVGLLPFRVGEHEAAAALDLSGVASPAGKSAPGAALHWADAGGDAMHAVRRPVALPEGRNRPVLDGHDAGAWAYAAELAQGFVDTSRALARRREELLASGGPLERCQGDPSRAVLRATRTYGLLLDNAFHPDFLRDALERDLFLDRLWVGVPDQPALEALAAAEHRALWRGDVPCFGARPGSSDLWLDDGQRVPGFFAEPPLRTVEQRLLALDEDEIARQAWLVRVSLGSLRLQHDVAEWPGFALADPGQPAGADALRAELLAAARDVGAWFERLAVRGEGDDAGAVTWVGLSLREGVWSLFPSSEDLYAGIPGIALFLGHLGAAVGGARYTKLARLGLRTLLARLDHAADAIPGIGLFQGWGGVVYALAHLGRLWSDAALLGQAEALAERIDERIARDVALDVVGGAAGAIAALLALHHASASARALALARRCGDHLVDAARSPRNAAPDAGELCWRTPLGDGEPQTGFSHGAAGIALALARLGAVTGDARYRATARAAFAFERAALRRELDAPRPAPELRSSVRTSAGDQATAMGWCYGVPGAGLARLCARHALDDPALDAEVERALDVTRAHGFGQNHSLCHGDLGNLDLLLLACAQATPGSAARGRLETDVAGLTRAILASVRRDGWICGTLANVEVPGLMNGLAGIGYGLLRAALPERIPSVLALEPPRTP